MSEIPFVDRLGDALEAAIAAPEPAAPARRLGRRRWLAVALAALTIGGGAALAEVLSDPAELGLSGISCHADFDTGGGAAIVGVGDPSRSPLDLCAEVLASEGLTRDELIVCRDEGAIVVLRRPAQRGCRGLGFTAVPAEYEPSRERVAELTRRAVALERSAGCAPPHEFARRLEGTLRDLGWAGWRATVSRGGDGPCGRVSGLGGGDGRTLAGMSLRRRTVAVRGSLSWELEQVLYGSRSLGASLFASSGGRCFTVASLERHVRDVLAPARAPIRFTVEPMPANTGVEAPRGDRYAEGCAIFTGAHVVYESGSPVIVAELRRRGAGR